MEHIKHQLNINLNKRGLRKIAESSYICYIFEEIKEKILGKNLPSQAISFDKGILKIKAPNQAIASEIRFRNKQIRKEINKKIGKEIVLKIDVRHII